MLAWVGGRSRIEQTKVGWRTIDFQPIASRSLAGPLRRGSQRSILIGNGGNMRPLNLETPRLVREFEDRFNSLVVGQPSASERFAKLFGQLKANVSNPHRPKRVLLLVGPTGVGKTLSGRVFNRLTKGNDAQIEVHCDGFVHEGYASMVIGSPVGYRDSFGSGGREGGVEPILSQNNVDRHVSGGFPATVLFDEIEKGGPRILNLLLGVMEDGKAQLGNGTTTDMTNTVIVMTTNAGAHEMQRIFNKRIGFLADLADVTPDVVKQMQETALHAVKKEFPPEFCNRVDDTIVFLPLRQSAVAQVMEVEIVRLQRSLLATNPLGLLFNCGENLKSHLLARGFNMEYGARNMRRTVDNIVSPVLANLLLNGELDSEKDYVQLDCDAEGNVCAHADGSVDKDWIAKRREQLLAGHIVPASTPSPSSQPDLKDERDLFQHPALVSLLRVQEALQRAYR
jgi:ATP-dependent Clp protease ATP-binding subunit ClpC